MNIKTAMNQLIRRKMQVESVIKRCKTKGIYKFDSPEKIEKKYPYKIPRGYIQWDELSMILSYSHIILNDFSLSLHNDLSEESQYWVSHALGVASATRDWYVSNSPVFVVSQELMDVITKAILFDTKKLIQELLDNVEVLYPKILFLFPSDNEVLQVDGVDYRDNIDYCIVEIYHNEDEIRHGISVFGLTNCGLPFSHTVGIDQSLSLFNNIEDDDPNFSKIKNTDFRLQQIYLQLLLLISSKPEVCITTKDDKTFKGKYIDNDKGFAVTKHKKVIYPRVVNLEYTEKTVKEGDKNLQQGSHSPKRPHWRLGYTVNKPIGKMKGIPKEQWERKLITVKPYLVRGNADQITNDQIS